MALKSQYMSEERGAEISELLGAVEKLLDRTKVLYEQYFMGIQKVAPSQLHRDLERKIRELSQGRIRNTALRYRLTTLTQKFGVYNTYWRRTLRQIEQGRYVRDVARVKRRFERKGEDVPDEILAAMPKRMRDRVRRDRDAVARRAEREAQRDDDAPAVIRNQRPHAHVLDPSTVASDNMDAVYADLLASAEDALDALEMKSSADTVDDAHVAPPPPPRPPRVNPGRPTARPQAQAASAPRARRPRPTGRPVPVDPSAANPRPAAQARPLGRTTAPTSNERPHRGAGAFSRRSGARPAPRGQAARSPGTGTGTSTPAPPPGMSLTESRALYTRYVKARQKLGERTDDVSYARLMHTLNQQAPRIMKQYKASGVQFDVAIKNDKVILRAKPKPK